MIPKTVFLRISGFTALILGIIGIPLPVLPTTPFLLLALYCFARSSPKMQKWLLKHKILGQYISGYSRNAGTPRNFKVVTIIILWVAMLCSIIWGTDTPWLRVLLLCIAIGISLHIIQLKGIKNKNIQNGER